MIQNVQIQKALNQVIAKLNIWFETIFRMLPNVVVQFSSSCFSGRRAQPAGTTRECQAQALYAAGKEPPT